MLSQLNAAQPLPAMQVRAAGVVALATGAISAVGVVLLLAMFASFARPALAPGIPFGSLNDLCVAIQYGLAIVLALVLHRLLLPYNPPWMRIATVLGIAGMVALVLLQAALLLGLLPFERQVGWVVLAMFGGVGPWLVITGMVAKATGQMAGSMAMSIAAVPYFGFPVWAIWLGLRLLGWQEAP